MELYFTGDDDCGPYSPRNELESLYSILIIINSLLSGAKTDTIQVLQVLKNIIMTIINSVGVQNIHEMTIEKLDADTDEMLLTWGEDHGVRTKLKIACKSSCIFFLLQEFACSMKISKFSLS